MKIILGTFVGFVVAGAAGSVYWGDTFLERWREGFANQPAFRTVSVMRGDLFIGVTSTGTVEPVQIIDVGAQIVGSVKSFGPDPDKPGQTIDYRSRVEKGTVLAQLDDLPHRAELDKASANMKLAEAELSNNRARHNQAQRVLRRSTELRGVQAEADYEKAVAESEMAEAAVAMAEAKLEQARIAKTQAEINLGYTVIQSPVDGVVIDRRVNVGQTVVAGMNAPSLFLLAKDLSQMAVWAAVNEADIAEIHVGQSVTFSVDAHRDREFSGKVSQIRLNASQQHNVVSYGVIVDVDNTDGSLLPYMTAKLQFEIARRPDAVLVPNQALRWRPAWSQVSPPVRSELQAAVKPQADQPTQQLVSGVVAEPKVDLGSPTVWLIANDGFVRPVTVEVGLTDGMVTEILSGNVKPGDAVVTNFVQKSQPDFVSSFVSPLTEDEEQP